LAIAYAAFANGGYKIEPQIIRSIKTAEGEIIFENKLQKGGNQVLKKETTQLLSQMLQNAINKGTGTSLRNAYGVGLPLAGKTGTSQNYADAWFAGYNPDLVMVSRVGASSPSIHFNSGVYGSGSKLALPLVALTL
jgi:penicillin-binding protein 1A